MGLDWIVEAKEVDGVTILPQESIGQRRLSLEDREAMAAFEKIWEANHAHAVAQGGVAAGAFAQVWGLPSARETAEKLLAEVPEGEKAPFVSGTGEELPDFCSGGSFVTNQATSWRGKRLNWCEVIIGSDLVDRAYEDMEPDEALAYAAQLEAAYGMAEFSPDETYDEYEPSEKQQEVFEDIKSTVHEAALFLRFWAERGHGIYAWS